MLELAEVEACDLADLLKSVNESVSMYEELSGGFRNVQIVLEEALNGHKCLAVEGLHPVNSYEKSPSVATDGFGGRTGISP